MKLRLTTHTWTLTGSVTCACTQVSSTIQSSSSPNCDGGVHTISGWESDWGHHSFKYNVNVPLLTYWLHDAEFKELAQEARLHGLEADETDPWHTTLDAILWCASDQTSEEELNKALSWALVDKTA